MSRTVNGQEKFGLPQYPRDKGWWARMVCKMFGHLPEIHHAGVVKRGTKTGDIYVCPRCFKARYTKEDT